MSIFQSKNHSINSDEYEKITKRIIEIHGDYTQLKAEINSLRTDLENLRGIFNRKLSGIRKQESQDLNEDNPIILPYGPIR
jgi:molecular chaperone GrpE (heat shock protein)